MTEWVSQGDAVRLLGELGDAISQQALSQYLSKHPEVPREVGGPGRPTHIDFAALRRSRETRLARGPAEKPDQQPELAVQPPAPEAAAPKPDAPVDEYGRRKAKADVDRAEADARRARVLADEAEGRVIDRSVAATAFMAAGVALSRAFEENRRVLLEDLRTAKDQREAGLVIRAYEKKIRAGFASGLADMAAAADPALAAAQ